MTTTRTVMFRCDFPVQSAKERLSDKRHTLRMSNDKYRKVRAAIERNYEKLTKIGVGPGARASWYRGTRGSGFNNDKRASILAHTFDGRRIGL